MPDPLSIIDKYNREKAIAVVRAMSDPDLVSWVEWTRQEITRLQQELPEDEKWLIDLYKNDLKRGEAELNRRRWLSNGTSASIPPDIISDIKSRVDLVDEFLGRGIPLHSASNGSYKGLCPWHDDNTPSLVVWSDHFHCFGCGAHGDIFNLMERADTINFGDSVRMLSKKFGIRECAPAPIAKSLPQINISDQFMRHISNRAIDAIVQSNNPPHLFVRARLPTSIEYTEDNVPVIETVTEDAMRGIMERSAAYVSNHKDGPHPTRPPMDIVRDVLSLGAWPFPPLIGIVESPVIRPDGSVLVLPGYDNMTRLYYTPAASLQIPQVSDEPADVEISAAKTVLEELIYDFPFVDDASRANAIAALFTPFLRPMISSLVPMVLFDKPQAGTGASLLARIISLIATGRDAAMLTCPQDDEAWRKTITSLLLAGRSIVTVDNIETRLFAPSLGAALTATIYQDRLLGFNQIVTLPHRIVWIGTGNNIRLGGDLPRRCYWVRLDAKCARPWQRKGFLHTDLIQWATDQRGIIIASILTCIRAWIAANCPQPKSIPVLGGFDEWAKTLGGILDFIGIPAFLDNLTEMYEQTDDDTPQWENFLAAWHDTWGDVPITIASVAKAIPDNELLSSALPDDLADGATKDSRGFTRKLGKALSRRCDVRFPNGLAVKRVGTLRRAITWSVSENVS